MNLKDKRVLVFGSGISGIGAVTLLEHFGAEVVLYDSNEKLTEEELLAALEPRFGFASALYPACLTKALSFRSVFIHSKKLWNRRKEP